MREVRRTSFFLPAPLLRRLRIRAAEEERSPSAIVEDALEKYLAGPKPKVPQQKP